MFNEEDVDFIFGLGVDIDVDGYLVDDFDDEDDGDVWMFCLLELGSIMVVVDMVCVGMLLSWNWNGDVILFDGFVIGVVVYEVMDIVIFDFFIFIMGQLMDLFEGVFIN